MIAQWWELLTWWDAMFLVSWLVFMVCVYAGAHRVYNRRHGDDFAFGGDDADD